MFVILFKYFLFMFIWCFTPVFCCFASFIFPSSLVWPQVCLLNVKTEAVSFWFVNIPYFFLILFVTNLAPYLCLLFLLTSLGYSIALFPISWFEYVLSVHVFSLSCFLINVLQAINFPLRLVGHRLSNVKCPFYCIPSLS